MRGKIASMRALTAALFVFGSVPAQTVTIFGNNASYTVDYIYLT
jgi:hypothetical protein